MFATPIPYVLKVRSPRAIRFMGQAVINRVDQHSNYLWRYKNIEHKQANSVCGFVKYKRVVQKKRTVLQGLMNVQAQKKEKMAFLT